MLFYRYFEFFLNIENALAEYTTQLEFSEKSKHLYSHKISLLLLQTCPIIESYMVQLCATSSTVQKHSLYDWEYNWKLWDSNKQKIKLSKGKRSINNFPKFSYVMEKVFSISSISCAFYFSDKFQNLEGNSHLITLQPFKSLSKFTDFNGVTVEEKQQFPIGLDTPTWWTAYNKIKHDLDEAEKRVNYQTTIEALAALFILLSNCDINRETLQKNGFIKDGKIKTRLFASGSI